VIELKNTCSGYGKRIVVEGISATFERGSLTCIIGPNGCGKSTLLKAVSGIIPISSGEITIDGISLVSLKQRDIAKRISYLAQGKNTPEMTVGELVLHGRFPHLSYPRRYGKGDLMIAKNAMNDMGIEHLSNEKMSSLSGGMKQNAYIAMALAQDTEYILMDEPTTYLDISHQLELMKLLRELARKGKGIVAVLHDLPLAMTFSDKILVMNNGSVVAFDVTEKISSNEIIKNIFGVELRKADAENRYFYDYGDKDKD